MSKQRDLTGFFQVISEMGRLEIARRRAEGETIGQAPLGFRKVQVNGKSTIAPDPETFSLLMLALQMRQDGCTLREVCDLLAKKGMQSKRGMPIQPNGMGMALKKFGRLVEELSTDAALFDQVAGRADAERAV